MRHGQRQRYLGSSLGLNVLMLALLLGGCSSAPKQDAVTAPTAPPSKVAWSSKSRSYVPDHGGAPRLHLPAGTSPVPMDPTGQRGVAIELLVTAGLSDDPLVQVNAIESLAAAPEALEPVVRAGLASENRGVRFASAIMIGYQEMDDLAHLLEPLRDDASESVQAAAIFGLRRNGHNVDLTPLGAMVMSRDPEVKANAALILGQLGDPSAIPLLQDAARQRDARLAPARARIVELQIAEALVELGLEDAREIIRAALFAPEIQGEIVALACAISGRTQDRAYASALLDKALREGQGQQAPEIRLAAVQALAQIDPSLSPAGIALAALDSDRAAIRAQAATALGWQGDRNNLNRIARLLDDPNALVQVAAAGAVVRMTS